MAFTVRTRRQAAGGALLLAIGAGTILLPIHPFAAPEHETAPPAAPPVVPPDVPVTQSRGHAAATPESRTRARACDGAEGAMVAPPRPIGNPQNWFTSDDYPWVALVAGREGVTMAEIGVSPTGGVIACGVAVGSGHFSLDTKTCAVFRTRARFEPARDDRGCPVASIWHKRVRWRMVPN